MSEAQLRKKVQVWILHLNGQGKPDFALLFKTKGERDPINGSFWQPITGSPDPGETLMEAALRETEEESGLKIAQLHPTGESFVYEGRRGKFEEHVFYAEITGNLDVFQIRIDSREHTCFEWVAADRVSERLAFDSNRQAFLKIISKK